MYVSSQDNVKTARGPVIILEVGSLAVVQAGEVFLAARGGSEILLVEKVCELLEDPANPHPECLKGGWATAVGNPTDPTQSGYACGCAGGAEGAEIEIGPRWACPSHWETAFFC